MVEVDKTRILKVAFALLVLGNSQVFMKFGLDRIILYLGLGIILVCSFLLFINQNLRKINKAGLGIICLTFVLLSIGIAYQELYWSKKMTLIISNLILVLFATISRYMISSIKCIYACSIGISIGLGITILISLFIPNIILIQPSDIGIGFTGGLEHKNYFGTAALSGFIGAYYYFIYSRKKTFCHIIMLINVVLMLLSSSRGAIVLLIVLVVIVNSYKIIKKFDKWIKIISITIIGILGLFILLNLKGIENYNHRILGIQSMIEVFTDKSQIFWFGASGIAHKDDNYVTNVREFLNWKGTPEMAFVAIMVKGGMLALVGHFILFGRYLVDIKSHKDIKIKYMLIACLVTFITSMLVETYVMNINLVYCPFSYCVLSSLCYLGKEQKEECIVTSDNG